MMLRITVWCSFSVIASALQVVPLRGQEGARATVPFNLSAAATPTELIHVPKDFQVELLYSVPKEDEGSWVNLCVDPKGRLLVSDQYGGLYRITLNHESGSAEQLAIEKVPAKVGESQGLLWAFDSLYVMTNGGNRRRNGLYRVRDSDGDDHLDAVEFLRHADGGGEHGPHAIIPGLDGKSLYVVCGNNTKPIKGATSRVPEIWDEDLLLPRIYGVGFMKGIPAPGGAIYKIDPDGKTWERVASGFRNPFDIAFNADGELFTYDADMEWDIGTPWYRPTRICHAVSGSDWGWRNGSGKWPVHFADTLPPAVNLGLGSPTGITFGYGAKFPAKYQNALFVGDWTYGKMFAVHLQPHGSSYTATAEEFMWATPLPLTDMIIHPADGAMYFLIGGRKTQSGLYRLTYVGNEPTVPTNGRQANGDQRGVRQKLERLHQESSPEAVDEAWPYLGSEDRFLRHAARTAIEHQPVGLWKERALAEPDPQARITALLALARSARRSFQPDGPELDTPPPVFPVDADERGLGPALASLAEIKWQELTLEQQVELLRAYELALYRLGPPSETARTDLIARLEACYPATDRHANAMLLELLCYLQSPRAAEKGMKQLAVTHAQEEQVNLIRSLQYLREGWTTELRRQLFEWFVRARSYRGGNNFNIFMQELRNNCLATTSESDRSALAELIQKSHAKDRTTTTPRSFVKDWTAEEVLPLVASKLTNRNYEHGKRMFAAANCFGCHHFAGDGGAIGPDLTGLAGRFSPKDILEAIIEPSKVISDQYAASVVLMKSGETIVGRLTNFQGEKVTVNTDMLDPKATVEILRSEVDSMEPSATSMMPAGLLNTLNEEELLDLMAFLLSRGNSNHEMFKANADAGASAGTSGR